MARTDDSRRRTITRLLAGLGAASGAALLARPQQVVDRLCPEFPHDRVWLVRLLGARLLAAARRGAGARPTARAGPGRVGGRPAARGEHGALRRLAAVRPGGPDQRRAGGGLRGRRDGRRRRARWPARHPSYRCGRVSGMDASFTGSVFLGMSVDGFIARLDGDIAWLTGGADAERRPRTTATAATSASASSSRGIDALVMGRSTYDVIAPFDEWPYQGKPVHVLSTTLDAGADPPDHRAPLLRRGGGGADRGRVPAGLRRRRPDGAPRSCAPG